MKAYKASLLNSLILIVCGLWGFYSNVDSQPTALIPAIIGVLLLGMNDGIKRENKTIAHIAVFLTLLSFANIMPLIRQIEINDALGIFRASLMLGSSLLAMIAFVQSFINARKA